MEDFINQFKAERGLIDAALNSFLEERAATTDADLLSSIKELVNRGGKRLRPILTIMAYEGCGGSEVKAALNAAIAQELLHTFLLIHDDLIDEDLERHGGPNISGFYRQRFKRAGVAGAEHMADNWALLAGDMCFSLANQALLECAFEPRLIRRALALMQDTALITINGQFDELRLSQSGKLDVPAEQILKIYAAKTAAYSFSCPLQTGALLAGATQAQLRSIQAFAEPLGIAYQLGDDLQEYREAGIWQDYRQAKLTVLTSIGFSKASAADHQTLVKYFGSPGLTPSQSNAVRQILLHNGSLQAARDLLKQQLDKADERLASLPFNSITQNRLKQLIAGLLP